jgi:hypothetical protein
MNMRMEQLGFPRHPSGPKIHTAAVKESGPSCSQHLPAYLDKWSADGATPNFMIKHASSSPYAIQ